MQSLKNATNQSKSDYRSRELSIKTMVEYGYEVVMRSVMMEGFFQNSLMTKPSVCSCT